MRDRWRIVLVDEFQDTDPVQWEVFDRAFNGHSTMVLIGDPKQAIYAFRGGDVTTYLTAAATATTRQTLDVNRRSDRPLLDAFQTLLGGAELGDSRIVVHPVIAHHEESRLAGAPSPAPFRLRVVRRDDFGVRGSTSLRVGDTRPHIALDLALDIKRLLASERDLRRPAAPPQRRRGYLLPARRPRRGEGRPAEGRGAGRDRRRWQRVRDPGRDRVAGPAGGARAAPPCAAGAGGRTDLFPRLRRRDARRTRRRPHRRHRRPDPRVGRSTGAAGRGRGAGGGVERRTARAAPRRGGRRAAAHGPAPHRGGAARGDAARPARSGGPARLAAPAGRGGPRRTRGGAHPPPRLRRGGGAAR